MPSTVKLRVKGARNLPSLERTPVTAFLSSSSPTPGVDAYVTVSLGGHSSLLSADHDDDDVPASDNEADHQHYSQKVYTARTKVCRRTFNPTWEEEFRFEVADDALLQDEPLIFRVWDFDAVTNDESIGVVYVDLNPLLTRTATDDFFRDGVVPTTVLQRDSSYGSSRDVDGVVGGTVSESTSNPWVIDGWFPLYDTLGGVRGELGVSIKLKFIGDVNPFRDSSAGVQLFPFSMLDPASGYSVVHVFGFVEELVVADDPEEERSRLKYEALKATNTLPNQQARSSNETRQSLLYLLDSSVRRRMCKKVLEIPMSRYLL